MANCLLAAAVVAVTVSPARAGDGAGWRMGHHSFVRTLTYDDTLGDWLTSAGTMALRDRVQLLPPVPDRYGLLWSNQVVSTTDFEAKFTLSAIRDPKAEDYTIAFWLGRKSFAEGYKEEEIVKSSKDWLEGAKAAGLNSLMLRPDFQGLGVVFLAKKASRQHAVSTVWCDGSGISLEDFVEGRKGAQMKDVDWDSAATTVKVRVKPDGSITGHLMMMEVKSYMAETAWALKENGVDASAYVTFMENGQVKVNDSGPTGQWKALSGGKVLLKVDDKKEGRVFIFNGALQLIPEEKSLNNSQMTVDFIGPAHPTKEEEARKEEDHWVQIFSFPAGTMQGSEETWLGFSGYSGTTSSVEVNLHRLDLVNFDASKIGEEEQDVFGATQSDWMKVLEHERRYVDQASQTEAVARLTKLLTEHTDNYNQLGERLRGDLVKMEERLDTLAEDMNTYLSAAQAWVLESQSFDPKVVKDHITGIRTILSKDKARHDQALDTAMKSASDLKAKHGAIKEESGAKTKVIAVAELSKSVEDLAEKGSMQTNALLLMMVISVAGLGLLFLNRMRYYEKKHYI